MADPTRVYIDMIGDLFHGAHHEQLTRAAELGAELVVGVFSDATCADMGYTTVDDAIVRARAISANKFVADVIHNAPIAPNDAFFEEHGLTEQICLDTYDQSDRQLTTDPWDERRAIRLRRATTSSSEARINAVEAQLATLQARQELTLEALGCINASLFNDTRTLRSNKPDLDAWSDAIRASAAEQLGARLFIQDSVGMARPWITRVRDWSRPEGRVSVLGEYDVSVAYGIADDRVVSILRPGSSPGVARLETDHLPPSATPPQVVACDWHELDLAMPRTDLLAITDSLRAIFLLRRRNLLWRVTREVEDAMVIEVSLSPTDNAFLSSRNDHFYCSDTYVRAALHYVRFMEVVNLGTSIDGLPDTTGACRPRVSRFTRRKGIEDGEKFRFLDDGGLERIDARVGTAISRVYLAAKRIISDKELAFIRGERGEP